MSWLTVLAQVLTFLAPYIKRWLEELLEESARGLEGTADSVAATAGVAAIFDAAEARLWWFQFAKRHALRAARKVAIPRAPELFAAARLGTDGPRMSPAEAVELRDASGL